MSYGNYKAPYVEDLHLRLINEFHKYRKEQGLPIEFPIDGITFSEIVRRAKVSLYQDRPDAEISGGDELL
jgi:hypothetical protein